MIDTSSNTSTLQTLQPPSKSLFGEFHTEHSNPPTTPPCKGCWRVEGGAFLHSPRPSKPWSIYAGVKRSYHVAY